MTIHLLPDNMAGYWIARFLCRVLHLHSAWCRGSRKHVAQHGTGGYQEIRWL